MIGKPLSTPAAIGLMVGGALGFKVRAEELRRRALEGS